MEHLPACEYDLDTLVLLIVPLSSLRIAFSVFIRHLLSTSYRSLSGDSLVRIRYGICISTLNVPILFFLPCQKTSDVLSQCLRKTFYYFSSVGFSFAKAFLPRQMKCTPKVRQCDKLFNGRGAFLCSEGSHMLESSNKRSLNGCLMKDFSPNRTRIWS